MPVPPQLNDNDGYPFTKGMGDAASGPGCHRFAAQPLRVFGQADIPIAALYVETGGGYFGLPGVDAWDEPRDARLYNGPHPVVAHPPCQRWGRFWGGNPMQKPRLKLGDDQGCFAAALNAVRTFGGVLEHPEASHAWAHHGLNKPPKSGGWIAADFEGGWTCCVEQGHYGHLSRKATWLYAFGVELPELIWGPARDKVRVAGAGFHTKAERDAAKADGRASRTQLPTKLRNATPAPFRDLLLSIARSTKFAEVTPGDNSAHPASKQDDRKSRALNLGDGAETQHVYISRPVVAFSNRFVVTEQVWRRSIVDALKNAGDRLPDADGLAHALIEAPFHDHNDTPGEARNHER